MIKKNNSTIVKNQIINNFMKNGKKYTGEKILLKLSKSLQKSTQKSCKTVIQLAITNITPAFKLNEQITKMGKRKSKEMVLSFIVKDSLRVMNALKSIKNVVKKDKSSNSFYKKMNKETLAASTSKGMSVEQKTKLQSQILLNKKYLAQFRW